MTIGIVLVMGIISGINQVKIDTYPFAIQYLEQLTLDNEIALRLNSDLITPNKQTFPITGIHISEDLSQCKPDCTQLTYTISLSTTSGQLSLNETQFVDSLSTYKDDPSTVKLFKNLTYLEVSGPFMSLT